MKNRQKTTKPQKKKWPVLQPPPPPAPPYTAGLASVMWLCPVRQLGWAWMCYCANAFPGKSIVAGSRESGPHSGPGHRARTRMNEKNDLFPLHTHGLHAFIEKAVPRKHDRMQIMEGTQMGCSILYNSFHHCTTTSLPMNFILHETGAVMITQ